ncbi:hypothetical protein B566_EDAN002160 [Ephemera danica]|nr:hypothetical protein B566_EDAN002160 [Ephemera danica]
MRELHVEFALVDAETASRLQESASTLDWPVRFICIGPKSVENMTSFTDLLRDDGNDCPEELDLEENEDIIYMSNTSGSTGKSKAVQYTSKSAIFGVTEKKSSEIESVDLSFLKCVVISGSVLDIASANLFTSKLPHVTVNSIVDLETRVKCGPEERGEILVKTPSFMAGYFRPGALPFCSEIDEEGWFQTGDIGFFDTDGNLYVIERISFLFKYYMSFVSPVELESVLQEHEAVEAAGVVGVPNPETTNLARAFVVLRPGYHVSAAELKSYVASRLPPAKHLHGGIRFVTDLPQNRGGKLDRVKLRDSALA